MLNNYLLELLISWW